MHFKKKLSKSNIGKSGMHDKYITIPKLQINPIEFFGKPPYDIKIKDKTSKSLFLFPYRYQKNKEYRLSKFSAYFKLKNAEVNDYIFIEKKKNKRDNSYYYIIDLIKNINNISNKDLSLNTDEEPTNNNNLEEGNKIKVWVNKYERNKKARDLCIAYWKSCCAVCNIEFKKKYGPIGEGYIHVHHITPLSTIGKNYTIDPIKDLIPVCPNCHAMIHKKKPPYTINEISNFLIE
jgi:predicted HNH restriction endonuclease